MNRAERRARKKKGLPISNEPCYNMKQSDIKRIKEDTTNDAVVQAFTLMLAIPVMVMRKKYGWGTRKRLPEFAEAILDEYTLFQNDEMTIEEYQDIVMEYCGINFKVQED